jgi:TatD DNase family protein
MAAMLQETRATVVLHSFSSGPAVFAAGLEIGAYFSFSGMVTFRNWSLTDQLAACPRERLLVETDAPYLAPVPFRGQRNEPAHVREVATQVARLRGETFEDLARSTTANAVRLFGTCVRDTDPFSSGDDHAGGGN